MSLHSFDRAIFWRRAIVLSLDDGEAARVIARVGACSIPLGTLCKELIFGVVITKNWDQVVRDGRFPGGKPFLEGRRHFTLPNTPSRKVLVVPACFTS